MPRPKRNMKKGGCKDCSGQCGEGAKLDALKNFLVKGARVAKTGADFVAKNKDKILSGIKTGTELAGVAGSLTGSKALQKVGNLRGLLGDGKKGKGKAPKGKKKKAGLSGLSSPKVELKGTDIKSTGRQVPYGNMDMAHSLF